VPWGLVCAEAVGDVNLHGHRRGCHHDAVIIPLYMYIPISLTRLLLYFRKGTVLIRLKSKFLLLYTLAILTTVDDAKIYSGEWNCLGLLLHL